MKINKKFINLKNNFKEFLKVLGILFIIIFAICLWKIMFQNIEKPVTKSKEQNERTIIDKIFDLNF